VSRDQKLYLQITNMMDNWVVATQVGKGRQHECLPVCHEASCRLVSVVYMYSC